MTHKSQHPAAMVLATATVQAFIGSLAVIALSAVRRARRASASLPEEMLADACGFLLPLA
jgi:hypothetical protein